MEIEESVFMKQELKAWYPILKDELDQEYFLKLVSKIEAETRPLCPDPEDVFNAFTLEPSKVKVVILGQDPYINGEAHGYSFSSRLDKIPPSLRIIFKEIQRTEGAHPSSPLLTNWVDQGVLLLNRILTTVRGISRAHANYGWEQFTSAVLRELCKINSPKVFLLWGADAKFALHDISQNGNHLVLTAPHPMAERYASDGKPRFSGCGHFATANEFLLSKGITPIDWKV